MSRNRTENKEAAFNVDCNSLVLGGDSSANVSLLAEFSFKI
jgi:hypothetical protein